MGKNELPDNQQDRVSWVIRAPDNEELRRRYDIWAHQYNADLGNIDDYLAPRETVKAAATDAWVDCGYADIFAELADTGTLSLVNRGEAFQMLPTTEPQFYCKVLMIEKH